MLSNSQLTLLVEKLPPWAELVNHTTGLLIHANVPKPNGGSWPMVPIEISTTERSKLQAREFPPNLWPTFCPQRHINEGGYFCLGLSDVPIVDNDENADRWWNVLSSHLALQFVADATKIWPPEFEWDHGEAGETQAVMEQIADDLLQEVRNAHFYGRGWLAGELPRLTKSGDRLVNGRAPCPRGCKKRKHVILRRACEKRELIYKLVKLERLKRKQSAEFWKSAADKQCCMQMQNCPLRKDE